MALSHQAILGGGCRVFKQDAASGVREADSGRTVQPGNEHPLNTGSEPGPEACSSLFKFSLPGPRLTPPPSFLFLTAGRRWRTADWSAAATLEPAPPLATLALSAAPRSLRGEEDVPSADTRCCGPAPVTTPAPTQPLPTRVAVSTPPILSSWLPAVAVASVLWVAWILEGQARRLLFRTAVLCTEGGGHGFQVDKESAS